MKKSALSLAVAAGLITVSIPALAEVFPWSELRRADSHVEDFAGQGWFCQAKTSGGSVECSLGKAPPKPGCYVILNQDRTAWVSVDDAAGKLSADVQSPDSPKNLSASSGYGCGTPKKTDYWLLYQLAR